MEVKKIDFFKSFLLVGLVILPLFYWPSAPIPYELPKVYFVDRWIEMLVVLGVVTNLNRLQKEKLDMLLIILVGSFLIIAATSSYLGVNFQKSIFGNHYRSDGLITLSHLVGLFLTVLVFVKKDWIKDIAFSISLGAFLVSIWALFDSFKLYVLNVISVPNWDGAIGVSFGNPNFLAGYLVVTLPFTAYVINYFERPKKLLYFVFITQIVAILATRALAGILGVLVFFFLLLFFQKTRYHKIFLSLTMVLLSMVSFVFISQIKDQRIDRLFAAEGRERIIRKGLLAFEKRPILGWGWANFDYAFDSVVWPVRLDHDVYVDKAHSLFLEILVSTGIIGFIFYSATIFRSFTNLLKMKDFQNPLIYVLILFLVHSQTNIISIGEEIIFWTVLGISAKKFKNSYLPNLSTEKYS